MTVEAEDARGHERVEGVVHRLIAICREGEAAYRSAAEKLADLHGQALFMDLAEQRSLGAAALSGVLPEGDAQPARRDSLAQEAERVASRPVVPSAGPMATVAYLRQVEERTLDELGKALAQELPMEVRTAIDQQYRAVRRAYGRLMTFGGAQG